MTLAHKWRTYVSLIDATAHRRILSHEDITECKPRRHEGKFVFSHSKQECLKVRLRRLFMLSSLSVNVKRWMPKFRWIPSIGVLFYSIVLALSNHTCLHQYPTLLIGWSFILKNFHKLNRSQIADSALLTIWNILKCFFVNESKNKMFFQFFQAAKFGYTLNFQSVFSNVENIVLKEIHVTYWHVVEAFHRLSIWYEELKIVRSNTRTGLKN